MNRNRYTELGYTVLMELERSETPMTRKVKTDDLTEMANECFDLPFDGTCKFYPFILPKLPEYKILAVTGRSGSGKSTILKEVRKSVMSKPMDPNEFVVTGFGQKGIGPVDFRYRTSKVGLDPDSIVTKRFGQLSEGEKFRVEVALNLDSNTIFDEFTSMVDRTVAEKVSKGLKEIAEKNRLRNITLCSCHKDFIGWVMPDLIIDLDDFAVYGMSKESKNQETKITEEELIGTIKV